MRIRCICFSILQAVLILSVGLLPVPLNAQGQNTSLTGAASKGVLRLEDGTPIKLRLSRTVSSASAHVGDRVDFEVLEDVSVGGIVVVPKGSIAWGTVTEAHPKRRMGRGGKLNINIDSVRLADGQKAALRAVKDTKGGGHVGAMTGAIVATSIVFFPAAPLFLFMHGKDITIPKGTAITAYIDGGMNLEAARFIPNPAPPSVASQVSQDCAITVRSTPVGADITIDGKYSGSTPSKLELPAGNHVIKVGEAGFNPWKRTIAVNAGGNVTVDATLKKIQ